MKGVLQIRIADDHSSSLTFGGDMTAIAHEIGNIALENKEFAAALNRTLQVVNDEHRAIEIRDTLIGFIVNEE